MKLLSKFFLAVLLLTVASVSWATCPEGTTTFIYDNPVIERLDWTDSGKMIGKSWPAQPDPWIWCVTPDAWDTLKESDCKARDGESFDTMEEAFAEYQQLQQK